MKFSLNTRDFLKGLVLAVVVPALVLIQQSLSAGEFTLNWKELGMSAVAALIAYLLKNFLTDDVQAAEKTLQEADAKGIPTKR